MNKLLDTLAKSKSALMGILTAAILAGCNGDQLDALKKSEDLLNFKLELLEFKDSQVPIVSVDESDGLTKLVLEDQSMIEIETARITSISYDSLTWVAGFVFDDGSAASAYFIGKLVIDAGTISLDPYALSPLAALVNIKTPIRGKFAVKVHKRGESGIALSRKLETYTDHHSLPVLGLYANHLNTVEFTFSSGSDIARTSATANIKTLPLPPSISPTVVVSKRTSLNDIGFYNLTSLSAAIDQNGDIRWYVKRQGTGLGDTYGKLANGNIIVTSTVDQIGYHFKTFIEMEMTGRIVKQYSIPNHGHHEVVEMPSGNFLVASSSVPLGSSLATDGKPEEDAVVEIDRATGAVVKTWDMNLILDPTRKSLPDSRPDDWFHINSVVLDKSDNSLVISGRSQSAVVKVDYQTGSLKWILAHPNEWNAELAPFLLKPLNANAPIYCYGQHAAKVLPNGNLLVYDNGDYRGYYDDPAVSQHSFSRAVEYRVNGATREVDIAWEFTNDQQIFTTYTGWAESLGNDNYQIGYMSPPGPATPKILEVDKNKTVKFDMTVNQGAFYYRSYKFKLYDSVGVSQPPH